MTELYDSTHRTGAGQFCDSTIEQNSMIPRIHSISIPFSSLESTVEGK